MASPQDFAMLIGDSRIAQNAPGMPQHGYGSAQTYEWFSDTFGWFDMSPPGDTNWSADVGQQWNTRTTRSLGSFVRGSGGTNLLSHWDPGNASHAGLDTALASYSAAGSPTLAFCLCWLGPNSIQTTSSWTKSDIVGAYGRLGDAINALNGSPLMYLDIFSEKDAVGAGFSGGFSSPLYRSQMDTYRQAVLDVIGTHSCRMGHNLTGELYADHTHPDTLAFATYFGQASNFVVTGSRGPRLIGATLDATNKIIKITANQDLSNSIGSTFAGMRVMDGGSPIDLSTATLKITTTRLMTITLSSAIVGSCTVSFASASDAVGAVLPVSTFTAPDNSTFTIPLEPFFSVATTAPTAQGGHFGSVMKGIIRGPVR